MEIFLSRSAAAGMSDFYPESLRELFHLD